MADAEEFTTWLDASTVTARLGSDIGGDVDAGALDLCAAGVRSYVQAKRPDLWVQQDDDLPPVFEPGADVVLGAALLAYRLYQARTLDPTDTVADDPRLGALLGVGGRFVFGGAAAYDLPVVVP